MSQRLIALLLKCYPYEWRSQYGAELADILQHERLTLAIACNVLWSALREQARRPSVRFLGFSVALCAFFFSIAAAFSPLIWRFLSAPAVMVLRDQRVRPPALISLRPMESFEIVWLGVPLLASALAGYPGILLGAWHSLGRKWSAPARRLYLLFATWSGTLFVFASLCGLVAWQHGAFSWLLAIAPDPRNAPLVSMSHLFELFGASTIGAAALLQLPLLAFFSWRRLALRSTHT